MTQTEIKLIDPATLRPDADLADLGRPMEFQLLPKAHLVGVDTHAMVIPQIEKD